MKLGRVTNLDKRDTTTFKKVDNGVISAVCDIIVLFSIYGQFEAIQEPDSGRMVYKT